MQSLLLTLNNTHTQKEKNYFDFRLHKPADWKENSKTKIDSQRFHRLLYTVVCGVDFTTTHVPSLARNKQRKKYSRMSVGKITVETSKGNILVGDIRCLFPRDYTLFHSIYLHLFKEKKN